MMKRRPWLTMTLLSAATFFLLGWLISSQAPKVRAWVLVTIEKESRENLPVRILPGSVEVDLFPLGATVRDVKILPKDEIADILSPSEIKRVSASISLWQLVQGRLRLGSVEIEGADLTVNVPKSKKRDGKPLEGLFKIVDQVPVRKIRLDDVKVTANLADPKLTVGVENLDLLLEKGRFNVALGVDSAQIRVFDPDTKANVLLDFSVDVTAAPDALLVEALKIRRGDSFIVASGEAKGDTEALSFTDGEGQMRAEMKLDSMRDWAVKTFPRAGKMPHLKGRAFFEANAKRVKGKRPDAVFKTRAEDLSIDNFTLGKLETEGTFKNDVVKLPSVEVENPSGVIKISDAQLSLPEPTQFSGKLSTGGLKLHELLAAVGVKGVPIWMGLTANLPCTGFAKPNFVMTCKGTMKGDNLLLRDSLKKDSGTIVALKTFEATGDLQVDAQKVTYNAEIAMPESKGRSKGVIEYHTGFKIDFEGDRLAFKDVTNLANLHLEGVAKVKGSTQGDSHTATVSLNLDGNDMWFENYWLGNAKGGIAYKAGSLYFTDLQGFYSVSRYNGDVTLNLHDHTIAVNARVPFFDARDLMKAFSRRVKLSFPVLGTGQAQIKAHGPLQFNHLSYDLKSSLFRGSVAGETFDQAFFDVKSVGGEVKAERVQITKGSSLITLTGTGHPNGDINTVVKGRGIRIEDTATVAGSGLALSGLVDFDMDMKGYVLGPDTDLRGTLSRTSIGDASMPDSSFQLRFLSKTIEGSGKFLGDVVSGEVVVPLAEDAPFRLKLATHGWNFAPLFTAIAGPQSRKDFEGKLTTRIDLSAPTGGFWNASGDMRIDEFSLSRGSLALKSKEPLNLSMRNGQLRVKNFQLGEGNLFVKLSDDPSPSSKLDLQVNGKLDLGLVALLTPFFEDLRGLASFAFNVRGGDRPLELLGSAYVERGYLKFFDFPHPFEDLRADVVFNQQKVLFNSIKSEFGGGRIVASGGMEFKGAKNFPVAVSGTFDKITLNVPDKIQTTGSGQFTFTGNNFPFLLKGEYNISQGLMTKNFGGETAAAGGSSEGIRRDFYLPEFLLEEEFSPLIVDLQINFPNGIAVRNELVEEGKAMGSIAVRGNPTKPSLNGSITTDRDTKVTFRETVFEVTSSNIEFNGAADNPKIYVSARSRVDQYDVTLLVQGSGQKPEFSLTSVPPLPEKDIVSLLAMGATDSALDTNIKSNEQASKTGLEITSGVIKNNPISQAIKDRFGFDVQFSTGFDDSNEAVPKIIVSKKINKDLDVTGTQAVGSKTQNSEVKARYRLNDKISLIGSWKGAKQNDAEATSGTTVQEPDRLGVDVEYKVEFK